MEDGGDLLRCALIYLIENNALSKESTHKKNLYWFVMGGSTPHYRKDLRRPAEPSFG